MTLYNIGEVTDRMIHFIHLFEMKVTVFFMFIVKCNNNINNNVSLSLHITFFFRTTIIAVFIAKRKITFFLL